MTTREQNRNNKRREIERFDWFVERIQTCVAFGWLSERSGEKTSLAISTFPIIHFVCVFFAPNTRKQFCIRTVFILSWDFQSSREKCKQCVWKTTCVCWGGRGGGQETCKQSVLREMRKWLHARKLSRNQSMLRFDSYCNAIGQSNNAFSILGFSLAGKRRGHVLIFSSNGW